MKVMEVGQIVCSLKGSDKGSFLLVVRADEKSAYLVDGKRYKLEGPKRKNFKHISLTQTRLNMEELLTDKAVRKALAVYRNKCNQIS